MKTYLQQALIIWFLLQLFFSYFEYKYKPDLLYILSRLIARKYVIPSLIIPVAYLVILGLLKYLIR